MDFSGRRLLNCRKLRSLCSCSSLMVVHNPFVTQRPIPMVQPVWWTIEITRSRAGSSSAVAIHQVRRQFPVVAQRLIPMVLVTMGIPQLLFIDKVDVACWAGPAVRAQLWETVEIPQLQPVSSLDHVVDVPVVAQRLIPMVLVTMGIPQLLFIDKVDVACWAGPAVRAQLWETVEIPQLQPVSSLDHVVDIPVVAQMLIPLVRLHRVSSFAVH